MYLFFKRIKLNRDRMLLQIVNVTDSVIKQNVKMENESLTVLNACISHEFRNPLNSISAQNYELRGLVEQLREKLIDGLHEVLPDDKKRDIFRILSKLNESIDVHDSSTELMTFLVQDLLDFAQLKAGKFRKNISKFNIRDTVKKVMRIQRRKADAAGIELIAKFPGLASQEPDYSQMIQQAGRSPVIMCDESRLIQVLLNL